MEVGCSIYGTGSKPQGRYDNSHSLPEISRGFWFLLVAESRYKGRLFCRSRSASGGGDKTRGIRHGVKSLVVAPVGVRSEAKDGNGADAGRTRAAAGKECRPFFLLKADGSILGFAKNGDTINLFPSMKTDALFYGFFRRWPGVAL